MIKVIKDFLRDERGFVTIESLVVMGGSVWMAGVVLTDVATLTMNVVETNRNRLDYNYIVAEVLQEYGPEDETTSDTVSDEEGDSDVTDTGADQDSGSDSTDEEVDCVGNPGNDKCVGNAGENPNGGDDWGSGSNGMSDSGSTGSSSNNGNSSSSSSSPGNSGNAPGKNKNK